MTTIKIKEERNFLILNLGPESTAGFVWDGRWEEYWDGNFKIPLDALRECPHVEVRCGVNVFSWEYVGSGKGLIRYLFRKEEREARLRRGDRAGAIAGGGGANHYPYF